MNDETNPNAPAGDPAEPTQPTSGATQDTTEDNLLLLTQQALLSRQEDAVVQVTDLVLFLQDAFPEEIGLSNRQVPERPVDTAIRLLKGLSATSPSAVVVRCGEAYCNQPEGHSGDHGMVNYG